MSRSFFAALALLPLAFALPARAGCEARAIERAAAEHQKGDFRGALALYEEAIAAGGEESSDRYDAACAAARAGERDRAFAHLGAALALGFRDCALMRKDDDLEPVRQDGRFGGLLARCDANRARDERFWNGPAWKSPYGEALSEADRLAALSRLWSEAKFAFANFDLVPDLDWDAEYRAAIPKVLAARSTAETYRVLQELAAKLRDGHTAVWLPKELQVTAQAWPAISTQVAEGRVLVREVLDPALEERGIRKGLEIVEVEGVPVRAYGQRLAPLVSASTPQDLEVRTFERRLLDGAAGSVVSLTLADEEGRRAAHALPRLSFAERNRLRKARPLVSLAALPDGIVHVTIRSFNDEKVVAEFENLRAEIAAARGVVLDLRENGGGNSANGDRILATLVKGRFPGPRWWTREYRPAMRAWGNPESAYRRTTMLEGSAEPLTSAPAVVLIGPRTYSAAEDFTVAFRDAKRGRLVGEPTGGSTGQPLRIDLPGGGGAQICAKRNTFADGTEFVGVGIRPDVEVVTTFEDVRAGRDPVLARAVRLLVPGA